MSASSPATLDRERLAKLLALLGSDHAGERDNAGLAAHRLITKAGLTWAAVLVPTTDAICKSDEWMEGWFAGTRAAEQTRPPQQADNALFVKCCEMLADPTRPLFQWEAKFVRELSTNRYPSKKDLRVFRDIVTRLSESEPAAKATGGAA